MWCVNGRTKGFTFSRSAEQVVNDRFDENGVADNAVDIAQKLLSRFATERTKLQTNFFRRFNDKIKGIEAIEECLLRDSTFSSLAPGSMAVLAWYRLS